MVTIQFDLKNKKAGIKTSIRCFFYYRSKRFMYSLGDDKTIIPELWDKSTIKCPHNPRQQSSQNS